MATSPSPTRESDAAYVFDRGQTDQARLQRVAELFAAEAREACGRAGLGPGGRAVDVGCGPLGALPVLAELVGPTGAVVGLDFSPEALAQARLARRLAQLLGRFDCPSAHALGEFELGLGTAAERRRIGAHVQGCPLCAGELRVLREQL